MDLWRGCDDGNPSWTITFCSGGKAGQCGEAGSLYWSLYAGDCMVICGFYLLLLTGEVRPVVMLVVALAAHQHHDTVKQAPGLLNLPLR